MKNNEELRMNNEEREGWLFRSFYYDIRTKRHNFNNDEK